MCIRSECVTSKGDLANPYFGGGVGRIPFTGRNLGQNPGWPPVSAELKNKQNKEYSSFSVSGTGYLNSDMVSLCLLHQWVRGIHFILKFTCHGERC